MSQPGNRPLIRPVAMPVRESLQFWLRLSLIWGVRIALLSIFPVILFSLLPVPATPLVAIRAFEALLSGERPSFDKAWVGLEQISPNLIRAAIASEDFRFSEHNGFDFESISQAREFNRRVERLGKGRIRGASTISQQTAKNVFLWPGRSWLRKGIEAWFTIWIEAFWPKQRILEVYLNVIEFGHGVYGVEAASKRFFGKPASALSSREAALMIAVLPNPRKLRLDKPSPYVRLRQSAIQRRSWMVQTPD
jgi:monofunctional biosynthetic peptidoglycan transglycosylase